MKRDLLINGLKRLGGWIKANQFAFLLFAALVLFVEAYAFRTTNDLRLLFGVFFYWFFMRIGKLTSKRTFQLVLGLLIFMFFSFFAGGASPQTERLAVWFVIFFAFGIIQQWREISS